MAIAGIIKVSGIKLYAYHGCLAEEAIIGGNYVVDVIITADLKHASQSDDLSNTVDYMHVYNIVKDQMAIRSKLVEHVCRRIAERLLKEITKIEVAEVTVNKLNPPMNADVEKASVTITLSR